MTMAFVTGRQSRIKVYGPPGIKEVVAGFESAYRRDCGYRVAHHYPLFHEKHHGFEIFEVPLASAPSTDRVLCAKFESAKLEISSANAIQSVDVFAFNVDHFPVTPSYGFRFEGPSGVIVVSGDTKDCPSLTVNSIGAHVIVQEAICCNVISTIASCQCAAGNTMIGKIMTDITSYHTSIQACVELAAGVKAPMMLLTHIVPAPDNFLMNYFFFSDVHRPQEFNGAIVIGEDWMIVRVDSTKASNPCAIISPGKHATWSRSAMIGVLFITFGMASFVFAMGMTLSQNGMSCTVGTNVFNQCQLETTWIAAISAHGIHNRSFQCAIWLSLGCLGVGLMVMMLFDRKSIRKLNGGR